MKYWYCGVKIKGIDQLYSYISDDGEIPVESYVEVPFGQANIHKIGVVKSCAQYDEDEVPYPLRWTKHIIRLATFEEYINDKPVPSYNTNSDCYANDWDYIECCVAEEDWDELLEWASDRHDTTNPETLKQIVYCYQVCVEQDMPLAALNLGALYYTGRGVEQNYEKAVNLYQIAADAGELRAICNLGYCYYYGRDLEVDYEKAHHYFELGALLYNDANCFYKLGDMYLNGYFVKQNSLYAFRLYDRALGLSEEADPGCLADIQFRLGKCLLRGIGVDQNVELANTFLHTALLNFYKRRKTDPFVAELIRSTKEFIQEAETFLDNEIMGNQRDS